MQSFIDLHRDNSNNFLLITNIPIHFYDYIDTLGEKYGTALYLKSPQINDPIIIQCILYPQITIVDTQIEKIEKKSGLWRQHKKITTRTTTQYSNGKETIADCESKFKTEDIDITKLHGSDTTPIWILSCIYGSDAYKILKINASDRFPRTIYGDTQYIRIGNVFNGSILGLQHRSSGGTQPAYCNDPSDIIKLIIGFTSSVQNFESNYYETLARNLRKNPINLKKSLNSIEYSINYIEITLQDLWNYNELEYKN